MGSRSPSSKVQDGAALPGKGGAAAPGLQRICVFCGSKHGARPAYTLAAQRLASELVARDIGLVYGGGTVGLMGEIARGVADGLGPHRVLGVIPAALTDREVSSDLIGDTRIVSDMHERKAAMARAADGFIAMPGGFGTLEELMEVLTWQQLGFHAKPIGLLNTEGFYGPLIAFFEAAIQEGFINREHSNLVVSDDPARLVQQMLEWTPPSSNVIADARLRKAAIGQDISQHVEQLEELAS